MIPIYIKLFLLYFLIKAFLFLVFILTSFFSTFSSFSPFSCSSVTKGDKSSFAVCDILNSLSLLEMDVLRYIEKHRQDVVDMNIQSLAFSSFSSTATILRLCKKLGYSGYSELKFSIKKELDDEKEKQLISSSTFERIIEKNLDQINKTASKLSKDNIMKVVECLKKKMNVHFFGKGLTSTVLDYASKQLMTCNYMNFYYKDTHIAYLSAEKMSSNDLLFLCSYSGMTYQLIRMGQTAKLHGAVIVTITCNKTSVLSKIGDYNFCVGNCDEEIHNIDETSSRLPILFLLNIIIELYNESINN